MCHLAIQLHHVSSYRRYSVHCSELIILIRISSMTDLHLGTRLQYDTQQDANYNYRSILTSSRHSSTSSPLLSGWSSILEIRSAPPHLAARRISSCISFTRAFMSYACMYWCMFAFGTVKIERSEKECTCAALAKIGKAEDSDTSNQVHSISAYMPTWPFNLTGVHWAFI